MGNYNTRSTQPLRSACRFGFPSFRGQQFWEPFPKIETNNPLNASERNHNLINNAKKMDIYRAQWVCMRHYVVLNKLHFCGVTLYLQQQQKWHCQWTESTNNISINGYKLSYAQTAFKHFTATDLIIHSIIMQFARFI